MEGLDSFLDDTEELSLEGLVDPVEKAPVVNKASNRNLAAHLSLLDDSENAINTYRQVNAELDQDGQSILAEQMVESAKAEETALSSQGLSDFLLDPAYDDNTKMAVAKDFLNKESQRYNIRNKVASKELSMVDADEDAEQEVVRLDVGKWINEINIYKREEQALMNSEIAKNDVDTATAFMDIAQVLTPYMENAMLSKIVGDFRATQEAGEDASGYAADAMFLAGSAKEEVIEALKRMNPEDRHKVKMAMAELISKNSSVVLADENDYAKTMFLETFLGEDEYTTADKWVDNTISLLDMTVLGGAAARTLRSFKGGAKTSERANKARSVDGEYIPKDRTEPDVGSMGETPKGKTYERQYKWTAEDAPKKASTKARETSTVEGEYYELFEGDWEDVVPSGVKAAGTDVRTTRTFEGEGYEVFEGDWESYSPTGVKTAGTGMRPTRTYEGEYYSQEEVLSLSSNKLIRSNVKPVSVAETVKDVNPKRLAAIHAAVVKDVTGETAEALYGATRTEAVASDLAPQMGNTIDVVDYKPGRIAERSEKILNPSEEIKEFIDSRGFIWASDVEKEAARAQAWNDFRNVKGTTFKTNMSSLKIDTDTGAVFNGIYGPDNGGYRNAVEGVNHVLYALRDYGITPKDITVLERTPKGYKPVNIKDVESKLDGDYVIQVKYDWELKPLDITSPEQWTIKRNLFDSFAGSMAARRYLGTISRNIFDPASMLDPRMMRSAYVAVDKSSALEKVLMDKGEAFATAYRELTKGRQEMLMDYFKEANYKGIKFRERDLKAKGFTDREVDVARMWRSAWDELYWLENRDMSQTLTNQGFKMLIDPVNGDRLLGKPVAPNRLKDIENNALIYDPVSQMTVTLGLPQLQAAYAAGQRVLTLRTPVMEAGKAVKYVISREQPGSSYTRTLSKHDTVLPYREGYYKVAYKQPQFVIERVKDSSGAVVYERAVSVAGTRSDAIIEAERIARVNGKSFDKTAMVKTADYYVRGDAKADEIADFDFDVYNVTGRSSQRYRGERISEANAPSYNGANHSHIANPAEALVSAARNISRRVPMREWLDAMKTRFMSQYKDVLVKDQYGRAVFPTSMDGIQKKGRGTDKDVRDARTAYAYIEEMESGYINAIDDSYKALLNKLGDTLGEMGQGKVEKGVRVLQGSRGPVEFSKNLSFHAYLVFAPLRQALIQAHQAMMYLPFNPGYVSKQLTRDVLGSLLYLHKFSDSKVAAKFARRSETDFLDMMTDLNNSGLIASIDKQNLVRSSLSSLSDELNKVGPLRAASYVSTLARKAGFDLGESINMIGAFNVFRDLAIKEGRQLTPAVLEEISAKARNISLGMNRAGDMPYNQTALGVIFQYLQAPHKMATLVTTNRMVTRAERIKLGAYSLAMWTLPAGTMYKLLDSMDLLPENEEAKNLVVEGAEAYLLNTAIGALTGSDTRLDLSSLSPLDPYGLGEFFAGMFSEGITDIVANSPTGQLFFGSNPRITDAVRTTHRWIWGSEDFNTSPRELEDVIKAFASIGSGFDSGFKAAYIREHGKLLSATGAETPGLDGVAALGRVFGFATMEEAERAYLKEKTFKANEKLKKNVKAYYDMLKRAYSDEGLTNKDPAFTQKVLGSASAVLEKEYGIAARKELADLLKWDLQNGDAAVARRLLKQSGFKDQQEIRRDLERIEKWDAEDKKKFFDSLDELDKTAEEDK